MVKRSDGQTSFDFKNLFNAHYFYGQLTTHIGRKFYKTVTTLYSLGFLELLLQTILGRGTRTLKYSNSKSQAKGPRIGTVLFPATSHTTVVKKIR